MTLGKGQPKRALNKEDRNSGYDRAWLTLVGPLPLAMVVGESTRQIPYMHSLKTPVQDNQEGS